MELVDDATGRPFAPLSYLGPEKARVITPLTNEQLALRRVEPGQLRAHNRAAAHIHQLHGPQALDGAEPGFPLLDENLLRGVIRDHLGIFRDEQIEDLVREQRPSRALPWWHQ